MILSAPAAGDRSTGIQVGDRELSEFTNRVEPLMPTLIRLAARLAPRSAPDDVVQEALIRAWRHRRRFNSGRGTFVNWLLAIVANEARRATGRDRATPVQIAGKVASLSEDDRMDLEAAVQKLPARQRLAIDCYYYVGLTTAKTAAVMGCSEGTVKSTLADARSRLRSQLRGDR